MKPKYTKCEWKNYLELISNSIFNNWTIIEIPHILLNIVPKIAFPLLVQHPHKSNDFQFLRYGKDEEEEKVKSRF